MTSNLSTLALSGARNFAPASRASYLTGGPAAAPGGAPLSVVPPGAAPLSLAPDMKRAWLDVDLSFDEGAELLVAAHRADGEHEDLPIHDLTHWTCVALSDGTMGLAQLSGDVPPLRFRKSAFGDFCRALGAGKATSFLRDQMPGVFQVGPVMHLMRQSAEKVSLRVRRGEITAVVGHGYAAFGAARMVEVVRESLARAGMLGEVRVRRVGSGLTDALGLAFPSITKAVKVGDEIQALVDFENSEFGDSALYVTSGSFRLACLNGARRYEQHAQSRFNHAGNVRRLAPALAEATTGAVAAARGQLEQWSASVDTYLADLGEQIGALQSQMFGLTQAEAQAVEASARREAPQLGAKGGISLFDLANAVTDSAKLKATNEDRLRIETVGGKVLARGGAKA